MNSLELLGRYTLERLDAFGDFCRFCGRTFASVLQAIRNPKSLRLLMPQLFDIGTRSIPVLMVTGAFVGMVLAVQAAMEFKAIGMMWRMGRVVYLSVLRELGPVLAGVMLAGRVGGGLTAELGTMRVTEQIDALRAMGAEPIRVLVVPRFLACVLLIPVMVLYTSSMGIIGGYLVSVHVYHVDPTDFWRFATEQVLTYDIIYGPIKSLFFGSAIGLICCHKGFHCEPGAAGVGRACTRAFVTSCLVILVLDTFLGMLLNAIYEIQFGVETTI
ncbi:MAG: MlaE family ABC transporter permease [Planctomycetota bacterium]|jgi:phospholipid/cholesterol/gamma-HCH transport system permease protein